MKERGALSGSLRGWAQEFTIHMYIYVYIYIHTYQYVYMYVYIYICVCAESAPSKTSAS